MSTQRYILETKNQEVIIASKNLFRGTENSSQQLEKMINALLCSGYDDLEVCLVILSCIKDRSRHGPLLTHHQASLLLRCAVKEHGLGLQSTLYFNIFIQGLLDLTWGRDQELKTRSKRIPENPQPVFSEGSHAGVNYHRGRRKKRDTQTVPADLLQRRLYSVAISSTKLERSKRA